MQTCGIRFSSVVHGVKMCCARILPTLAPVLLAVAAGLWGLGCSSLPVRQAEYPDRRTSEGIAVRPFHLSDQEGRAHRYDGRSEGPVLLIVSDRSAVPTNIEWDRWLLRVYGEDLTIFRLLDLSDVPELFRTYATSRVRDGAEPPGIPILLDWEGKYLRSLALGGGVTNVVVVRPDGRVTLVVSGSPDPTRTSRVAKELEWLGVARLGGSPARGGAGPQR